MTNIMLGVTINALAILLAGVIGSYANGKLKEDSSTEIFSVIAMIALIAGLSMALASQNILIAMASLCIAIVIGQGTKLDEKVGGLIGVDNIFNIKAAKHSSAIGSATIATLISLIGPLSVVGSIKLGMDGDLSLLMLKTGFDFIATFALASSLGKGVLLSIIPIFIFQTLLALLGKVIGNFVPGEIINEISATGGVILMTMALSVLDIKQFRVLSLLLGLLITPVIYLIFLQIGLI